MAKLVQEHHPQGLFLPSPAMTREINHGLEKACHEGCRGFRMNADSDSLVEVQLGAAILEGLRDSRIVRQNRFSSEATKTDPVRQHSRA